MVLCRLEKCGLDRLVADAIWLKTPVAAIGGVPCKIPLRMFRRGQTPIPLVLRRCIGIDKLAKGLQVIGFSKLPLHLSIYMPT